LPLQKLGGLIPFTIAAIAGIAPRLLQGSLHSDLRSVDHLKIPMEKVAAERGSGGQ